MIGMKTITDREGTRLGEVLEYRKAYSECGLARRAALQEGRP